MGKLIVFYLGLWITLYLIGFDFRFKILTFEDLFARFQSQSGIGFAFERETQGGSVSGLELEDKCIEGPTEQGFNFCINNN